MNHYSELDLHDFDKMDNILGFLMTKSEDKSTEQEALIANVISYLVLNNGDRDEVEDIVKHMFDYLFLSNDELERLADKICAA